MPTPTEEQDGFCHHVHFFASREAGGSWLSDRKTNDPLLLNVAQAHRLGLGAATS